MVLTGCSLLEPQEPVLLVEAIISIQTFTDELKVVADGSASRGRNLTYNWDFDDGTTIVDGNAVETHTYAVPGVYTIKLTVVEMRGRIEKMHTTNGTVDLRSNNRPRAVIQVYHTAKDEIATAFYSWEEVMFVGTGSWDPNGSPLSYWWEIGPVDADGNPVDSVYWTENPVVSNNRLANLIERKGDCYTITQIGRAIIPDVPNAIHKILTEAFASGSFPKYYPGEQGPLGAFSL